MKYLYKQSPCVLLKFYFVIHFFLLYCCMWAFSFWSKNCIEGGLCQDGFPHCSAQTGSSFNASHFVADFLLPSQKQ